MRIIAFGLGLVAGLFELCIVIILQGITSQFSGAQGSVFTTAPLVLAGLCIPGLAIFGSFLGLRRPLLGAAMLIGSTALLFAFAGTFGPKTILAELGTLIPGLLFIATGVRGAGRAKPPPSGP